MKISYKSDYALKALLELAIRYNETGNRIVPIAEIAKIGDMPRQFLEQILLTLVRGGFVKSKRGAGGGFYLARPPADITIGQVLRLIEGPLDPIACVKDNYAGCGDVQNCIFRNVWKEVAHAISIVVDTVTFEELVARFREKDRSQHYEYVI